MPKSSLILFLVVLGSCLNPVAGQTATTKTPPVTKTTNSQTAHSPAPAVMPLTKANGEKETFYKLGVDLAERGALSQAAENFQQAIRLDTEYAEAYSELGRTYFKMRQWQKAIDNLRRAAELHIKERERHEARLQSLSSQKPKEASGPVMNKPSIASVRLRKATSANADNVKVLQPKSNATQPTPTSTNTKNVDTTPGKLPQVTNNTAAVKAPPPVVNAAQATQQPAPTGTNTKNVATQPGKLPQATNNSAEVKALPPVSNAAQATQQPALTSTYTKNVATPGKLPQPTNNSAEVKALPPVSNAAQSTQQPASPNTNTKNVVTPPGKLPQATNTSEVKASAPVSNAAQATQQLAPSSNPKNVAPPPGKLPQATNTAEVKAPQLVSNAVPATQQPEIAKTPQNAATPSIQPTQISKASPADVNALPTEPEAVRKSDQTAVSEPEVKSDANNSPALPESVGVRVSLNLPPPSIPVETKPVSPVSTKALTPNLPLTKIYRVGPGDVLDIRLNDTKASGSTLFTVTPSGLVEHPILTEPLLVTGLTVEAIGAKIEQDLITRALIENPRVVVGVRDYASHAILVSGLVKDPGTKFLRREAIPLYVVVADAQPLPEAARVTLVRDMSNRIYQIDLTQEADMNFLVRPGDVITLKPHEIQFVYIGGEVKFPSEKTFRRGLTLTQAIMTAGVNPKSKEAQISRDNGEGFLVRLRFDLQQIAAGKVVDPLLRPGDRITILR